MSTGPKQTLLHFLLGFLAFGCTDATLKVVPEPPGVPVAPTGSWTRCLCAGCQASDGTPLGTEAVGGCSAAACGSSSALQQTCLEVCANYGFQSCTAAAPAVEFNCEPNICEHCSGAGSCTVGACYSLGHSCGRICNDAANDCGCNECLSQPAAPSVCVAPHAGAPCHTIGTTPVYLDRFWDQLTIALDAASTLDVDINGDAVAMAPLSSGSLTLIARDCPGSACAMRLNDLVAEASPFSASISQSNVNVTGAQFTNVKPSVLDVDAVGGFTIPTHGLETVFAFTAQGKRVGSNFLNPSDLKGSLNFATGAFEMSGAFASTAANAGLSLKGTVTNFPPRAIAGANQPAVECTTTAGAPVHLDGSGSTDFPPGPGIVAWRWYENFDRGSAVGTLIAEGMRPTVILPLGQHRITLIAVDGAGAMGLSDVWVTVIDTTPPVVSAHLTRGCLWPPNHKWVRFELGRELTATAINTCAGNLSSQVEILAVSSDQAPDGQGDGTTDPDIRFNGTALCVRAERAGPVGARTYSVTVGVRDPSGVQGTSAVFIVVPQDQGDVRKAGLVCDKRDPSEFIEDGDARCELGATPTVPVGGGEHLDPAGPIGCSATLPSAWGALALALALTRRRWIRKDR